MKSRFFGRLKRSVGFLLIFAGCNDLGSNPPPRPIVVERSSFSLAPGDSATAALTGGTAPYTILAQSDTHAVLASIEQNSVKLVAHAVGQSSITIGDNSAPKQTLTLSVTVSEIVLGRTVFNLITGDSASTAISGGSPPYTILSNSDSSKVRALISNTTLEVRALTPGSATIVVRDSGPTPGVTVLVNVTAAVSFTAQVQPIFTTNCVNAGCHPGGGAPFPLSAGVSYAHLVNVTATNGPCAGNLRVQPLNAEASALVQRLEGSCAPQMPLGGTPLPAEQIQLIRDWINQGARNN